MCEFSRDENKKSRIRYEKFTSPRQVEAVSQWEADYKRKIQNKV